MKQIKQHSSNETGAALVVALVLVLVSTLMGVSAMQVSDVENKLVNNDKFRQVAFRAAEAASEQIFTIDNLVILANDATATIESTSSVDGRVVVSAQLKPFGEGPATGYSLGGQNGFSSMKFVSDATAVLASVDSSSTVTQGVKRLTLATAR